jgi:hypothetical protein
MRRGVRPRRGLLAAAAPPLGLLVAHGLALRGLYAADVVARVLGAASPPWGLVLVLVAFYLLRIIAYFVAPGWLLYSLGRALVRRLNG